MIGHFTFPPTKSGYLKSFLDESRRPLPHGELHVTNTRHWPSKKCGIKLIYEISMHHLEYLISSTDYPLGLASQDLYGA
jgi:hypothetical protein